jgi:hypothetical protein
MWSLIRPSATFSRAKSGRRLTSSAFSRFFQREKVAEGRMRGFRSNLNRRRIGLDPGHHGCEAV